MFSQLLGWMSYYVSSQSPELKPVPESSSDQIRPHDEAGDCTSNVSSDLKPFVSDHSCALIPSTELSVKDQSDQTDVSPDNPDAAEKPERKDCRDNSCFDLSRIETSSTSLSAGIESALPLTVGNIEKHNELTDYDQVVSFEGRRTISTQTTKSTKKLRSSKKCSQAVTTLPVSPGNPYVESSTGLRTEAQPPDASLTKKDSQIYEELKEKIRNSDNVYGTLFVVGCNGSVPPHLKGSIRPKFVLRKRPEPNGLKEACTYTRPKQEPDPTRHSISYLLPDSNNSMVVAFQRDESTDMFQIGRHELEPVDFSVTDVRPVDRARKGVSRFACRIVVEREGGRLARVYASAFDASNTIFLGESGFTLKQGGKLDGFTTNGVLLMHPDGERPGTWREVSVCGNIYPLRSAKYEDTRRPRIHDETNVLRDGSLIDLCGVTLLWRTPEGLRNTPGGDYLNRLQAAIHAEVPECQKLDTLCRQQAIRSINYCQEAYRPNLCCQETLRLKNCYQEAHRLKNCSQDAHPPKNCIQEASRLKNCRQDPLSSGVKKAYVFISCGHIFGLTLSSPPGSVKGWPCPLCRGVGHLVELKVGLERGFYLDRGFPGYAFRPCGHVASLKTVKYWSLVKIPNHRSVQDSQCPFCGEKLNHIKQFVPLTLPCDMPRDEKIEPVFEME